MVSRFKIQESEEFLVSAFRPTISCKVRLRIQNLLLLKQKWFKRKVDLAEYLEVNHSSYKPKELKIVIIDNAGFHSTKNITIPNNIKLNRIPPIFLN